MRQSNDREGNRLSRSTVIVLVTVWILANITLYLWLGKPNGDFTNEQDAHVRDVIHLFEDRRITVADGQHAERIYNYRLLMPQFVDTGKTYPILVCLHGAGLRGRDNQRQLRGLPSQMATSPWREKYSCFVMVPQCPEGQTWSQRRALEGRTSPNDPPVEFLDVVLLMLEDVLRTEPVDRRRIYLTGYSMGGFGSWYLAIRRPDVFAAVVPICGGGDPGSADRLAGMPVWAVHGDADSVVPVEHSRRMIEAIREAGGDPTYSELKGVSHDSWTPAYSDPHGVISWMFEQAIE